MDAPSSRCFRGYWMATEIQEALQRLATLEADYKHLKEDEERQAQDFERKLSDTQDRLEKAEGKLARIESMGKNVGYFWLGVIALGYIVVDKVDSVREKLSKLLSWLVS